MGANQLKEGIERLGVVQGEAPGLKKDQLQDVLLPEAKELLNEVQSVTGKRVRLIETADVPTSLSRFAVSPQEDYLLQINPAYRDRLDYLVIYFCTYISRIYNAAESERMVPAISEKNKTRAINGLYYETNETFRQIGWELPYPRAAFDYDAKHVTQQLLHTSTDIRVQHWVWKNYPSVRTVQEKSLNQAIKNTLDFFTEGDIPLALQTVAPTFIKADIAMRYAWLKGAAEVVSKPQVLASIPKELPFQPLGQSLFETLQRKSDTHKGDRRVVDSWAKHLNLEGWYHWVPLDKAKANNPLLEMDILANG